MWLFCSTAKILNIILLLNRFEVFNLKFIKVTCVYVLLVSEYMSTNFLAFSFNMQYVNKLFRMYSQTFFKNSMPCIRKLQDKLNFLSMLDFMLSRKFMNCILQQKSAQHYYNNRLKSLGLNKVIIFLIKSNIFFIRSKMALKEYLYLSENNKFIKS